jgi:hypothetical protein
LKRHHGHWDGQMRARRCLASSSRRAKERINVSWNWRCSNRFGWKICNLL